MNGRSEKLSPSNLDASTQFYKSFLTRKKLGWKLIENGEKNVSSLARSGISKPLNTNRNRLGKLTTTASRLKMSIIEA